MSDEETNDEEVEVAPVLAGTTFQAINTGVPLNLAPQLGPHQCAIVNFNAEGSYTTDDPDIIEYLRNECSHLCSELEFEEQTVMVGKAKPAAEPPKRKPVTRRPGIPNLTR